VGRTVRRNNSRFHVKASKVEPGSSGIVELNTEDT
jgi:hypothetical protein